MSQEIINQFQIKEENNLLSQQNYILDVDFFLNLPIVSSGSGWGTGESMNWTEATPDNNLLDDSDEIFVGVPTGEVLGLTDKISFGSEEPGTNIAQRIVVRDPFILSTGPNDVATRIQATRIVCLDQQERNGDEMSMVFRDRSPINTTRSADTWVDATDDHMRRNESSNFAGHSIDLNNMQGFTLVERDPIWNDPIGNTTYFNNKAWGRGQFTETFQGNDAEYQVTFTVS